MCVCGGGGPIDGPFSRDTRACAVMCMLCPERQGDICTVTQLTVSTMMRQGCPRGHHPDSPFDITLQWLGLRWYGVPAPLRWTMRLLAALRVVRPLTGPLAGCGCVAPLKDRYERVRAWGKHVTGQRPAPR